MRKLREVDPELPIAAGSRRLVEIVDFGEMDLARPGRKPVVRHSLSSAQRRGLAVVITAILAAGSVWAWTQPRTSAGPSSSGPRFGFGATPTPSPSASAAKVAVEAPTLLPTIPDPPTVRGGWLTRVDVPSDGTPIMGPVGPDGTIYVPGEPPLDHLGHPLIGWMTLTDGSYFTPEVFGHDGTAYGVVTGADLSAAVWAFEPDGTAKYTYQLPASAHLLLAPAPDGSLYVLLPSAATGATDDSTRVLRLDASGRLATSWTLPSLEVSSNKPQFVVRANGTIAATYTDAKGCATHILSATGKEKSRGDGTCWMSIVDTKHGLIAWSSPSPGDTAGQTWPDGTIARLGDDGRPTPGWPRTFVGLVSPPAVGEFGPYSVVLNTNVAVSELKSLDWDGNERFSTSVPFDISAQLTAVSPEGARVPQPPAIGGDDRVYVLGDTSPATVGAFSNDGTPIDGWPVTLSGSPSMAPIVRESPGSPDTVFVVTQNQVQVVDPTIDPSALSSFRDTSSDFVSWLGWLAMPDGGVVAFALHSNMNQSYVLVAYLAGRTP